MSGIQNETQGKELCRTMEHARTFLTRLKGLLFRLSIPSDHGFLLWQTNSIHMFGMLFTIDVVFLDSGGKVLKLCPRRWPFPLPVVSWGATYALELAKDSIERSGLKVGDQLRWDPT